MKSHARPASSQRRNRRAYRLGRRGDGTLALGNGRQVLRGAVIRLQAAKAQSRRIGDAARERCGRLAGRHAATLHPDLDFDEPADFDTKLGRRTRRGVDLLGRVETQRYGCLGRQRGQAAQLLRIDHLVADENIAHATAHERLGLTDLLAALAHGTRGDLLECNRRAFVRFRVRSQPHARRFRERRHAIQVVFEGVEIDDQCRRVDLVDRRTDARGNVVHAGLSTVRNTFAVFASY